MRFRFFSSSAFIQHFRSHRLHRYHHAPALLSFACRLRPISYYPCTPVIMSINECLWMQTCCVFTILHYSLLYTYTNAIFTGKLYSSSAIRCARLASCQAISTIDKQGYTEDDPPQQQDPFVQVHRRTVSFLHRDVEELLLTLASGQLEQAASALPRQVEAQAWVCLRLQAAWSPGSCLVAN